MKYVVITYCNYPAPIHIAFRYEYNTIKECFDRINNSLIFDSCYSIDEEIKYSYVIYKSTEKIKNKI